MSIEQLSETEASIYLDFDVMEYILCIVFELFPILLSVPRGSISPVTSTLVMGMNMRILLYLILLKHNISKSF